MSCKWHFAAITHKDGVLLIAADSIIGFLRHIENQHPNASLEDVADVIERLTE